MDLSLPLQHQTTRKRVKRRTVGQSHFLSRAEGPSCETEAFPERTCTMSTKKSTTTSPTEEYNKEQGWHTNTEPCCVLKTILRSDRRAKTGKSYTGVLRRDEPSEDFKRDEHFTFTETQPTIEKRNPRVFNGRYITVTRRDDGTYRPNFRPMPTGKDFNVDTYAIGVCDELRLALRGLIKEK